MEEKEKLIIDGFAFENENDAARAKAELKKIQYIKNKVKYKKKDAILSIYNSLINKNEFSTPVGLSFLHNMRSYLLSGTETDDDEIKPITVPFEKTDIGGAPANSKYRIKPVSRKKVADKTKLRFAWSLNIILFTCMLLLLAITLKADNPNIINYENAIINKYAEWEKSLTEKEKALKEKERELNNSHL